MGALTQTQPVKCTGPARYRIGNWSLVGLVVTAACTLSSAPAVASLREYSPENTGAASNELPSLTGSMSPAASFPNPAFISVKSSRNDYGTLIDPLSEGSISRDMVVSDHSAASLGVNARPMALDVQRRAPKSEDSPLLIPLPSAISAGGCGLAGLALLLAPRGLRRRLLS